MQEAGLRLNIIIVSEGAIDREGNPIIVEAVKKVVVDRSVMIKTIMLCFELVTHMEEFIDQHITLAGEH